MTHDRQQFTLDRVPISARINSVAIEHLAKIQNQPMRDRSPSEQLIQQLAAGKLFRLVSAIQIGIHLSAYIATFIGLIIIKAGGYYDTEIFRFIGITLVSMPFFAIGLWLFNRSFKISKRQQMRGYFFHLVVLIWSIAIVKIGYWL